MDDRRQIKELEIPKEKITLQNEIYIDFTVYFNNIS